MRKMKVFGIALLAMLFVGRHETVAFCQDWKTTVSNEAFICGHVDLKAFFANYQKQACIAYNFSQSTASFEFTIGLGVGAGVGLQLAGFGAETDASLGYRLNIKIEGPKNSTEIIAACKSDDKAGKEFRGLLLQKIKEEMSKMTDEDLARIGYTQAKIDALKELPAFDLVFEDKEKAEKFEELLKKSKKVK